MDQILPSEICLNIVNYMNLNVLLKSYLYLANFKDFINTHTLDSLIEQKLTNYRIGIYKKQLLLNNKEKLYRFLKYVDDNSPFTAYDIANMDDNQYYKFDYLYNNGINYLLAELASNILTVEQLDKLVDIYKFIEKKHNNELFMCYDTIIKIANIFNKKQIETFYYLYQNGFKEKIAFDVINIITINNINIQVVINLYNDGCPDFLICPVLTISDITKRQELFNKIKSGMQPLDAYKSTILILNPTEGYHNTIIN